MAVWQKFALSECLFLVDQFSGNLLLGVPVRDLCNSVAYFFVLSLVFFCWLISVCSITSSKCLMSETVFKIGLCKFTTTQDNVCIFLTVFSG